LAHSFSSTPEVALLEHQSLVHYLNLQSLCATGACYLWQLEYDVRNQVGQNAFLECQFVLTLLVESAQFVQIHGRRTLGLLLQHLLGVETPRNFDDIAQEGVLVAAALDQQLFDLLHVSRLHLLLNHVQDKQVLFCLNGDDVGGLVQQQVDHEGEFGVFVHCVNSDHPPDQTNVQQLDVNLDFELFLGQRVEDAVDEEAVHSALLVRDASDSLDHGQQVVVVEPALVDPVPLPVQPLRRNRVQTQLQLEHELPHFRVVLLRLLQVLQDLIQIGHDLVRVQFRIRVRLESVQLPHPEPQDVLLEHPRVGLIKIRDAEQGVEVCFGLAESLLAEQVVGEERVLQELKG